MVYFDNQISDSNVGNNPFKEVVIIVVACLVYGFYKNNRSVGSQKLGICVCINRLSMSKYFFIMVYAYSI